MSKDIESQMRAALRAVAPSEEFSQRLLAGVTDGGLARKPRRAAARLHPLAWWFTASLAASLILAVGVHQHLQQATLAANRTRGAARSHGGVARDESETQPCVRSGKEPVHIADVEQSGA